jgi:hypothetical protein
VSEIRKAFKALTPEQQAVVTERRIEGERTPDEWLALLGPVAEFDQQADELRSGGGGFFAKRFARKHDVPDGLLSFGMPLLAILREDHDPAAPLEFKLDLTGGKEVAVGDPYTKGAYHKVVDTFFEDPWIEGRARFADGADVRFSVVDRNRSTKRWKRSASGKTKTKTRSKKEIELAVTVSFPGRNYGASGAPAPAAPATGKLKHSIKAGDSRTAVKLTRVVKTLHATAVPDVGPLLELLGNAYAQVKPARRKKL